MCCDPLHIGRPNLKDDAIGRWAEDDQRTPSSELAKNKGHPRDVQGGGQQISSRSYRITGIFSVEVKESRSRSKDSQEAFWVSPTSYLLFVHVFVFKVLQRGGPCE